MDGVVNIHKNLLIYQLQIFPIKNIRIMKIIMRKSIEKFVV